MSDDGEEELARLWDYDKDSDEFYALLWDGMKPQAEEIDDGEFVRPGRG